MPMPANLRYRSFPALTLPTVAPILLAVCHVGDARAADHADKVDKADKAKKLCRRIASQDA